MQLCGSLSILWHCLSLGLEWKWSFPVLWPLLSFPNVLAYWVQHFHSIIFQDLKQPNWNSITSTSFVRSDDLRPTWLHFPRCLALDKWSHHHDYPGSEDLRQTIFLDSEVTADGDCSHKIQRHLLLGRKAVTNLDSTLKSRNITLPTKVHLVKAMVFPVVMCGCESWTIKKAEHQRTVIFKLWCWRRLSRVHWTARRSKQSLLKEINPEYSFRFMLKLNL